MLAGNAARAIMALAALASFPSVRASSADSMDADIARVMDGFGLRGVWAPDCDRPASVDDPRLSIELSTPGLPEIRTWGASPSDAGEFIAIESAQLVSADMLELKLNALTSDPNILYDGMDTYQRIGAGVRLWRSERTWASSAAQALGYGAHVLRDQGTDAGLVPGRRFVSPILEQCNE